MKPVITDTAAFDAQMDLMDQLQRVIQMLARLCAKFGIDPEEAGQLPGEDEDEGGTETVATGQVL